MPVSAVIRDNLGGGPAASPLPLLETGSSGELVILLAPEFEEEECRAMRELLTRND